MTTAEESVAAAGGLVGIAITAKMGIAVADTISRQPLMKQRRIGRRRGRRPYPFRF